MKALMKKFVLSLPDNLHYKLKLIAAGEKTSITKILNTLAEGYIKRQIGGK